jgi:hypothetical protein
MNGKTDHIGFSQFVNLASGSSLLIGAGLKSCTGAVQVSRPFELDGRSVELIDTPGFDDTTRSDTDVLRMISEYLASEWVKDPDYLYAKLIEIAGTGMARGLRVSFICTGFPISGWAGYPRGALGYSGSCVGMRV